MAPTGDEPRARNRPTDAPDGEAWDDAVWVEVGPDNRWHPTFGERSRSALALAVLVGALLLVAAFASLDDGDGDRDREAAATTTTEATTEATTTTTTEVLAPASVDGEPAPTECAFDDRGASPLRDRGESTVLVLNGTPRGGHAGDTTDELEDLGYTSMAPDNASIRSTSSVEYLPGHCAEAVRLIEDLGVETTTISPHDDDDAFVGRAVLVLTLGRDSL